MKLTVATVRGKPRWKLESWADGKRKRQFFADYPAGQKALADAQAQRAELGRAWDVLSPADKARIMGTLRAIEQAGHTLDGVWRTFQALPSAPRSSVTLGEAVKEALAAAAERNCRPRYVKGLKWYLELFAKGRETVDVSGITPEILERWFSARGEKPRARKGHVSILSVLFKHCWRRRYITENPVTRLDPVHLDRETPATLSPVQAWRVMVWALHRQPEALAWLALTLFCGMRPEAEADWISWRDIDLDRGRITVGRSKVRGSVPRIVELEFCPPAAPWLKLAKYLGNKLPLKPVTRRRYVRKLRAFLKLARWPQDVLRHTAASNLLAYHQDAGKVAAFLGNSAGVLLRDYKALVVREDAAVFMRLLPKFLHGRPIDWTLRKEMIWARAAAQRWPNRKLV